jgi:hypothetical protein
LAGEAMTAERPLARPAAFNAKKEHLDGGGPQLDRLAGEVTERAARAGLTI